MFDAKQKLRTDQHRAQGRFDSRLEAFLRSRFPIELHRLLQIGVGHRPPIGSAHQRGQNAFGAAFFLARLRRLAHENPAAAGRVARTLRSHRGR